MTTPPTRQAYELHMLLSNVDNRERFEDDLADWLTVHVDVAGGYSFSIKSLPDETDDPPREQEPTPAAASEHENRLGDVLLHAALEFRAARDAENPEHNIDDLYFARLARHQARRLAEAERGKGTADA